MLNEQERKELEELQKDPNVKAALNDLAKKNRAKQDPEKRKLYQYRWLKKKGQMLLQQNS